MLLVLPVARADFEERCRELKGGAAAPAAAQAGFEDPGGESTPSWNKLILFVGLCLPRPAFYSRFCPGSCCICRSQILFVHQINELSLVL